MATPSRLAIDIPAGYKSQEAALFVAQLDDLSRRLNADLQKIDIADYASQPNPGTNTIGMLLAHIAKWEAFWTKRVLENDDKAAEHLDSVLGHPFAFDGMPIPKDGKHPEHLKLEKSFYDDLLTRARTHTRTIAAKLTDEEMVAERPITRWNGEQGLVTARWALYHIVEHQAGHYSQVLLINHLRNSQK